LRPARPVIATDSAPASPVKLRYYRLTKRNVNAHERGQLLFTHATHSPYLFPPAADVLVRIAESLCWFALGAAPLIGISGQIAAKGVSYVWSADFLNTYTPQLVWAIGIWSLFLFLCYVLGDVPLTKAIERLGTMTSGADGSSSDYSISTRLRSFLVELGLFHNTESLESLLETLGTKPTPTLKFILLLVGKTERAGLLALARAHLFLASGIVMGLFGVLAFCLYILTSDALKGMGALVWNFLEFVVRAVYAPTIAHQIPPLAQPSGRPNSWEILIGAITHELPRIAALATIEVLAGFLLRQYRISMEEFRYYEKVVNNHEVALVAYLARTESGGPDALRGLASDLALHNSKDLTQYRSSRANRIDNEFTEVLRLLTQLARRTR
jgi:hypothetical protein